MFLIVANIAAILNGVKIIVLQNQVPDLAKLLKVEVGNFFQKFDKHVFFDFYQRGKPHTPSGIFPFTLGKKRNLAKNLFVT